MTVRVAEVNTPATPGPGNLANDLNSVRLEMRLPCRQLLHSHSKTNVYRPGPIVRRNETTRKTCACGRSAAHKEQQNVSRRNVKGAETGIVDEHCEAEDLFVELLRSRQVIDVEAGFLQIGQLWHQVI